MGVKLRKLIESTFIPLSEIKGCKVAVDGMNMLFQILKTLEKLLKENVNIEFLQKSYVKEHIYGYPENLRKDLNLTWTSQSLDQMIIRLEKLELVKSYLTKEKDQKKMIKLTTNGKKLLKDFDGAYKFKF